MKELMDMATEIAAECLCTAFRLYIILLLAAFLLGMMALTGWAIWEVVKLTILALQAAT